MGGGSNPPAPVPAGQVAATQQGYNTQAGQQSQRGSMINQNNQYGSLSYAQTGTSSDGTPIYQSNLQLSPEQQNLYNILTGTQTSAGTQGANLINQANYGATSPTQAIGSQTAGIEGGLMGQWLSSQQPWMTQQTDALDNKLRNQGIFPSPTATNDPSTWGAYERAMGANTQAQQMGVAGAASQFQPQAFSEATQLYGLPAQLGAQLAQFGSPTSPGQSLVQTPGLNVSPADYAGAVAQQEKIDQANYQAQQAQKSAMMKGLFQVGGTVAGGVMGGPMGAMAGGAAGGALGSGLGGVV